MAAMAQGDKELRCYNRKEVTQFQTTFTHFKNANLIR